MRKSIFRYITYILPHFLFLFYGTLKEKKKMLLRDSKIKMLHSSFSVLSNDAIYDNIINDLVNDKKLDKEQIRSGSMPEDSLLELFGKIKETYGETRIIGLHVGNFVGVSLIYLSKLLYGLNPKNHIVSIDPNIPHRGVVNPQEKVLYLINKYGLSNNISILTGYSLEKSYSNDGSDYTSYDPFSNFTNEFSCENQLEILKTISSNSFSFAIIDGNHDKSYLNREVLSIKDLLIPNGLLILDDVSDGWKEIKELYLNTSEKDFTKVLSNNRIGILRKVN